MAYDEKFLQPFILDIRKIKQKKIKWGFSERSLFSFTSIQKNVFIMLSLLEIISYNHHLFKFWRLYTLCELYHGNIQRRSWPSCHNRCHVTTCHSKCRSQLAGLTIKFCIEIHSLSQILFSLWYKWLITDILANAWLFFFIFFFGYKTVCWRI